MHMSGDVIAYSLEVIGPLGPQYQVCREARSKCIVGLKKFLTRISCFLFWSFWGYTLLSREKASHVIN